MVRSKALNVLSHLNKEEFHRLEKFLASPYFNTNKNLIKLFKLLKKFYPEFTSPNFNKQKVFKYVYENESYNDEKLRKLFSDLYKELEKYLVIAQVESDRTEYNRLLLRKLDVKKLDNLFLSAFTDADDYLDKTKFNYGYFLEKFLLQWYYVSFYLDRGGQKKIAGNIFERGNYGTMFYLCDMLLTLNDITANRNTFDFDREPNLPEKLLSCFDIDTFFKYLEETDIKYKEYVKMYYYTYLANKYFEEENYFYELESFASDNWDKFSRIGQINIITYLSNYCNRKIMKGKHGFLKNLNNIYSLYLKSGLLIREENSYVRSDVFLKILTNFFKTGRLDEIHNDLQENINYLHPDHRHGILCYYKALSYFTDKKFDESLKELSLLKTNSELFINLLKLLQLKSLYELKLYDEAIELANNYKKFISNNKSMTEFTRNSYLNFLSIFRDLLKMDNNLQSSHTFKELKAQLNENAVAENFWLKDKLQTLEQTFSS